MSADIDGRHFSFQQPVAARVLRPLSPNAHRRRRRDSTVEFSRVGSVYWYVRRHERERPGYRTSSLAIICSAEHAQSCTVNKDHCVASTREKTMDVVAPTVSELAIVHSGLQR